MADNSGGMGLALHISCAELSIWMCAMWCVLARFIYLRVKVKKSTWVCGGIVENCWVSMLHQHYTRESVGKECNEYYIMGVHLNPGYHRV